MPIQISVSDSPHQEKVITLNRNSMFLTLRYNTRDSRWYFSLVDRNRLDIISGVKILPNQNLTDKYLKMRDLLAGFLVCVNTKQNNDEITRDNFGTDKQFQLWYYSYAELEG